MLYATRGTQGHNKYRNSVVSFMSMVGSNRTNNLSDKLGTQTYFLPL